MSGGRSPGREPFSRVTAVERAGVTPCAASADGSLHLHFDQAVQFERVATTAALDERLAATGGKPVMLDFYADWCVSCKTMEREVFGDLRVQARLNQLVLLRPDVTAYDDEDRALMRRLNVIGPPTILFFARNGRELGRSRIVGEVDTEAFLKRIAVLPEGT